MNDDNDFQEEYLGAPVAGLSEDDFSEDDEDITEVLEPVVDSAGRIVNTLNKAAKMMTEKAGELASVSPNSLVAAQKEGSQIVLDTVDGVETVQQQNSSVRAEVQAITEEQRQKALQYQQDKRFYEQHILQKSRSAAAINEDYIKILHPTYRQKFIDAVARYGTLAAGLRYMRDNYGISVRADVLRRMRAIIPAFSAEIEDAQAMYQGQLQMAMHQRAVEGVDKNIYDREGNIIAVDKVYSDALLAKMVDVHSPEYKEAKQKESSKGNTINVQIIKDFHNYKRTIMAHHRQMDIDGNVARNDEEINLTLPYKWEPWPHQMAAWDAVIMRNVKRNVWVWHRRAGKDQTALNAMVVKAHERVGMYWYVFPEYKQGREVFWDGFRDDGRKFRDAIPKELILRTRDDMMLSYRYR